jgi:hypothetical protein
MTKFRNTILASCAVGALGIAGMSAASAETYDITIYNQQTTTIGNSTDSREQANSSNPLIASGNEVWAGTFTGTINWNVGSSGTNTIAAFLTSNGILASQFSGTGIYTPVSVSTLSEIISTAPFATTSVFVITGTAGTNQSGSIVHDDGVTLTDGGGTVVNSAPPTSQDTNTFTGLTGAFTLDYVEANGLPAVLEFTTTPTTTPLPSTWIMLLSALTGLGFLAYRRKDKAVASMAAA